MGASTAHMTGMNTATPAVVASRTHVQIVRTGSYVESVVPPRCRNPRDVRFETSTIIDLPVVGAAEAPVAFTFGGYGPDDLSAIRLFDGQLYEVMAYNHAQREPEPIVFGSDRFPEYAEPKQYRNYGFERGLDAHLEYMADRFADLIVIDGYVWRPTSEPRYVVQTFGLGRNHGGTSLSSASSDNPNIAAHAYFRADDYSAAQAHAVEVAQRRGDTESAGWISDQAPTIQVHVAEAVRLVVPTPEPREIEGLRRELRDAVHAYERKLSDPVDAPGNETELFDNLVRLRGDLRVLTADIAGVDRETRPYEDR